MKKFTGMLLGICVVLMLHSSSAIAAKYVIGFANFYAGVNPYTVIYTKAIMAEAKKLDVELIHFDAQGDASAQINHMNDFIAKKVQGIILWPVDGIALIPATKKAHLAGLPVLITNSPMPEQGDAYNVGFSGPDDFLEGQLAAKLMLKGLNGRKANVVELTGTPGYSTAIARHEGFMSIMKNEPTVTILDSQPCSWDREKATRLMENYLVRFPKIDGVYTCDNNAAIGAYNAIVEAGRKVGGHDGIIMTDATLFGEGYDIIKTGTYYGSILQSPKTDGRQAIRLMVDVLNGKKIPRRNAIPTPSVHVDNVNEFDRPEW